MVVRYHKQSAGFTSLAMVFNSLINKNIYFFKLKGFATLQKKKRYLPFIHSLQYASLLIKCAKSKLVF